MQGNGPRDTVSKSDFDQLKSLVLNLSNKVFRLEKQNIELKNEVEGLKRTTRDHIVFASQHTADASSGIINTAAKIGESAMKSHNERIVTSQGKKKRYNYIPVEVLIERYVEQKIEKVLPNEIFVDKVVERLVEKSTHNENVVNTIYEVPVECVVQKLVKRDVINEIPIVAYTEVLVQPDPRQFDGTEEVEDVYVEVAVERIVPIETQVYRYVDVRVERLKTVDRHVNVSDPSRREIVEESVVSIERVQTLPQEARINKIVVIDKFIEKQM